MIEMGGQSSKASPSRNYAITQNRYNELMSNGSKLTNRQKASLKAPKNRRFQYSKTGEIINTNEPSKRVTSHNTGRVNENGKPVKLYSLRPGYTNKNFNRNHMQMNLGEAENKLTALKDQYANNPLATNEIDHALSELKGIKTLRVSEEEKRRKVAQLAETKTKLAQKDKFEQSPQGIAWNGTKTVVSGTLTVLGFIASILLGAAQGAGPAGVYVATQGPGAARIGGTKRHTKRR